MRLTVDEDAFLQMYTNSPWAFRIYSHRAGEELFSTSHHFVSWVSLGFLIALTFESDIFFPLETPSPPFRHQCPEAKASYQSHPIKNWPLKNK